MKIVIKDSKKCKTAVDVRLKPFTENIRKTNGF